MVVEHLATKMVVYDRIDLLHEGRRNELIADLEQRTGVSIVHLEIGKVDLLRDTANLKTIFQPTKNQVIRVCGLSLYEDNCMGGNACLLQTKFFCGRGLDANRLYVHFEDGRNAGSHARNVWFQLGALQAHG